MYNAFQLAKKYISYYIKASNGSGHGMHSPFVFEFIQQVLNNKKSFPAYPQVEQIRKQLLADNRILEVEDFGAGSTSLRMKNRVVRQIAASSLKPKKFAQLLHRIVAHYHPKQIIELGTSLGVTSSYLALGNPNATITTCEGSEQIAAVAQQVFNQQQLKNIQIIKGNFDETLPKWLQQTSNIDLAFIDGNHRKLPTIQYFEQLLPHMHPNGMLIFDDIHWSEGMEEAWKTIKEHPAVTLSIDLFFIGLIFISPDFKTPQHFTIRF
ncbi:MAG: hypothetical protein RLY16_356 [Bacteroidota bacterium]